MTLLGIPSTAGNSKNERKNRFDPNIIIVPQRSLFSGRPEPNSIFYSTAVAQFLAGQSLLAFRIGYVTWSSISGVSDFRVHRARRVLECSQCEVCSYQRFVILTCMLSIINKDIGHALLVSS